MGNVTKWRTLNFDTIFKHVSWVTLMIKMNLKNSKYYFKGKWIGRNNVTILGKSQEVSLKEEKEITGGIRVPPRRVNILALYSIPEG